MKFTAEFRYPADPTRVFAMLLDQQFQDEVCRATGALSHQVHLDAAAGPAGRATVATTRTLPADDLPDFVKGFVGSTLDVRRQDVWEAAAPDGSRTGSVLVEITGAPVRLTGTLTLAGAAEGGSLETITGDLKASVPLFGGKVEKAAAPAIRAAIAKEQEVGSSWLSR